MRPRYRFGGFVLDLEARRLRAGVSDIPLTPKAFDTLRVLVEQAGRTLSKDELLRHVWKDVFVEEGGLARNISVLRKALGESNGGTQFIRTVAGHGYCFAAPVVVESATETETAPSDAVEEIRTLAVLPFKFIGAPPAPDSRFIADAASFCLGMADALITKLCNVGRIAVRSTGTVRHLVGIDWSAAEAGRALKVEAVVEASLQIVGDRLRVTVQLVDVAEDRPLWAEKFDDVAGDWFAVQDRISERVARALAGHLTPGEAERLTHHPTENPDAQLAYLRGRFLVGKRTPADIRAGMKYFHEAIQLDPDYACAYSGLADAYALLSYYTELPAHEGIARAKEYARRALELDPDVAEAHATMGYIGISYDWAWDAAEQSFTRALALKPNYGPAAYWYAHLLAARKRFDESVALAERFYRIEPLSALSATNFGRALFLAGRCDAATAQLDAARELDEGLYLTHHFLKQCHLRQGRNADALAAAHRCVALAKDSILPRLWLAQTYAAVGNRFEALRLIGDTLASLSGPSAPGYDVALVYAALNDFDQAFAWLERAFQSRSRSLVFLAVEPDFACLRDDPRFADLVRRLNL
jgi:DNA-binding winged helix-turn-helix (wHTH) protein/tetratricopeptide (TPR) repeat protein